MLSFSCIVLVGVFLKRGGVEIVVFVFENYQIVNGVTVFVSLVDSLGLDPPHVWVFVEPDFESIERCEDKMSAD